MSGIWSKKEVKWEKNNNIEKLCDKEEEMAGAWRMHGSNENRLQGFGPVTGE
jgi:hypothetical protein